VGSLDIEEEAILQKVVQQLLPRLQKLRDLLDKAGNALKVSLLQYFGSIVHAGYFKTLFHCSDL
jgi:hypothetical protein